MDRRRLLLVGTGFVGGEIGRGLATRGWAVTGVSRSTDLAVNITDAQQRDRLGALAVCGGYEQILLCHGPSDVTWCEDHPDAAHDAHLGAAAAVAGLGIPVLLVSTGNVFPGLRPGYRAADRPDPTNAYGRAKLAAEQVVLSGGGQVVRASLVYGWSHGTQRRNFAEHCIESLRAERAVQAPYDQVMTPIHVGDVSMAIADVLDGPDRATSVIHLAGPDALSRADFARLAANLVGAPANLVNAVPRARTPLACRPAFTTLLPGPFHADGPLAQFSPRRPAVGLADMTVASRRSA